MYFILKLKVALLLRYIFANAFRNNHLERYWYHQFVVIISEKKNKIGETLTAYVDLERPLDTGKSINNF